MAALAMSMCSRKGFSSEKVYLKGLVGSELGEGEVRQGSLGLSDSCQLRETELAKAQGGRRGSVRDEEGIVEGVHHWSFDVDHHLRA